MQVKCYYTTDCGDGIKGRKKQINKIEEKNARLLRSNNIHDSIRAYFFR